MKIITLIGSSRFRHDFVREGARLEKQGNLVLCMTFFQHFDGIDVSDEERKILEEVDKYRISLSSWVFVINSRMPWCNKCREHRILKGFEKGNGKAIWTKCKNNCEYKGLFKPYVGESTAKEILFAKEHNKRVEYLLPEEMISEAKFSSEHEHLDSIDYFDHCQEQLSKLN